MNENPQLEDQDTLLNIYGRLFEAQSVTYLQQLTQTCRTGRFEFFDYGINENEEIYGASTPPEIPMENINIPIALFSTPNDGTDNEANTNFIIDNLGDNLIFHEYYPFGHYGFYAANDMGYLEEVQNVLEAYPPQPLI